MKPSLICCLLNFHIYFMTLSACSLLKSYLLVHVLVPLTMLFSLPGVLQGEQLLKSQDWTQANTPLWMFLSLQQRKIVVPSLMLTWHPLFTILHCNFYAVYCTKITYLPVSSLLYCQPLKVCACGLLVLFIITGTVQSNAQKVKMGVVYLRGFAESTKQNNMCQVF